MAKRHLEEPAEEYLMSGALQPEKNKKRRKSNEDTNAVDNPAKAPKIANGSTKSVHTKSVKTAKENGNNGNAAEREAQDPAANEKAQRKAAKLARKEEKKKLKAQRKEQADQTVKSEEDDDTATRGTKDSTNGEGAPAGTQHTAYAEHHELSALPHLEVEKFLEERMAHVEAGKGPTLRPLLDFKYLPSDSSTNDQMFKSFKTPTPIQAVAWPYLLSGRDAIGVAQTGSGKTLAFGVPCIRHVARYVTKKPKKDPIKAVVVSPTRELAQQIYEQILKLAASTDVKVVCLYGGVPKDDQRRDLSRAHIIIATPGRLNDFIQEGAADLSQVGYLVLDEADRMLEKGFEEEVKKIISATPSSGRQTLMFTATWPPSVRELAATFMNNAVKITIGDNPTGELRANESIKQTVEVVDPRNKERRLIELLKKYGSGKNKNDRILIFCLYKKEATRVENFIRSKGFNVAGIHGDLNQTQRMKSLEGFKAGKVPLLVATDVAARGLDIPNVKMVINCTFPLTVEDYVHRIGRTGRAGAEGLSITLFTEHDKAQSGALINVLRAAKQPVPDELLKFGTTVKKKTHEMYGAFYKEPGEMGQATKITFD